VTDSSRERRDSDSTTNERVPWVVVDDFEDYVMSFVCHPPLFSIYLFFLLFFYPKKNEKIHYVTKLFHFYIQILSTLNYIDHFLLLFKNKLTLKIIYQTHPMLFESPFYSDGLL
jgi:hypothetical protein